MFDLPWHPMMVHFPIALIVLANLMEMGSLLLKRESWHLTAKHLFIVAAIFTPLAVGSGWLEHEKLKISHPVMKSHELLGFLTWAIIWVGGIIWLWAQRQNLKWARLVFILTLAVALGMVVSTAHYGGKLVFEYGVGVE